MAVQAISQSGTTYATGGYGARGNARPIGDVLAAFTLGSLLRTASSRPLSAGPAAYTSTRIVRTGAGRPLSLPVASYASGRLLSLENLRLLSPALASYLLGGMARATAGRRLAPSYLLTIPVPPPPPVDATAPVVGNYDPPSGTPISKTTSISFDVTEETGAFGRIFVVAFYSDTGVSELVHDGDGFRGFYAATSTRRAIAGGFRYTVLRTGGWPAAPTIQTFAADRAGNEVS